MAQAIEYLAAANVEERIAAALRRVLRERPEDPLAAVAAALHPQAATAQSGMPLAELEALDTALQEGIADTMRECPDDALLHLGRWLVAKAAETAAVETAAVETAATETAAAEMAASEKRAQAVEPPPPQAIEPSLADTIATLAAHPATADRVLAIFGAETDGHIALEQLTEYLMARDGWCKKEDVERLFKALDADADGRLSRADLRARLGAGNVDGKPPLLWLKALTPPPSGVSAFAELVRAGGPVAIDGAEYRAMSLGQLKATLKHAQRRCQAEVWLGVRFPGGEMRHERLDPETINLYDVATHVILPATYGHMLPDGKTKPSFVELVADGMQRPDYFISHFCGEPHKDFVACVAQHTRDRAYGGGKFVHPGQKAADGDGALVWVCAYANRQWNLGGDVTDDPSQTSFHKAMRIARGTLAIVDRDGGYFTRVWCVYEIFVSLMIAEEERDAEARTHGRFTYDVYTALKHDPGLGERQAVGLVDGLAPADTGFLTESSGAEYKSKREAPFPPALLDKAMRAKVQDGKASVETDRQHILNSIAGRGLKAEVVAEHERYEEINTTLHGRVAADSLKVAIVAGGEVLDITLASLKASREVMRVGAALAGCKQATPEVMAWVTAALPASLEDLMLTDCDGLVALPQLSRLTQLRSLDLFGCEQLTTLPDISGLEQLQKLDLQYCDQLTALPDISGLKQLQTLNLGGCNQLTALPDISGLKQLQTLNLNDCNQLTALPDVSGLKLLETLDLEGCNQLTTLPDVSGLKLLETLDLAFCDQLTTLPDVSGLTRLQTLNLSGCDQLTALPDVSGLTQLKKYFKPQAVEPPPPQAIEPSLADTIATLAADPATADRVLAIFGAETDGHIALEHAEVMPWA